MSAHDEYAVMGNPIAHSQSPFIHSLFAQQTGQTMRYRALLVAPDDFEPAVRRFQQAGGRGLNITLPFKQAAYALAEQCSERAQQGGAVNTLGFDAQGHCWGDNTDGVGLVRDFIDNQGGQLQGRRLLILGAGGAVRGVLGPLLATEPEVCVVANRTVAKAETLASLWPQITACGYETLAQHSGFDVIINGTSASLHSALPPLPEHILAPGGWCYDMMYGREPTVLMRWAQARGAAQVIDGLGMLVEQAAESFYLWRGLRPKTRPVIQQLRQKLNEIGGPPGPEPTRYGDWERNGRCIDF